MIYEYLRILSTSDGKENTFERNGSVMHSDGETYIDVRDIYKKKVIDKEKIATFYISGYGSENSMNVPKGFRCMTSN